MKNKEKRPEDVQISVDVTDSLQKTVARLGAIMTTGLQRAVNRCWNNRQTTNETTTYPVYSRQVVHLANLLDVTLQKAEGNQTIREKRTVEIPKLVVGSVLPANRAFQLSTGTGKNTGDNQEFRVSLEDYSAGNMAGHEATLGVLRQILAAVSDISISDETITASVHRRQEKLAVVKGGQW